METSTKIALKSLYLTSKLRRSNFDSENLQSLSLIRVWALNLSKFLVKIAIATEIYFWRRKNNLILHKCLNENWRRLNNSDETAENENESEKFQSVSFHKSLWRPFHELWFITGKKRIFIVNITILIAHWKRVHETFLQLPIFTCKIASINNRNYPFSFMADARSLACLLVYGESTIFCLCRKHNKVTNLNCCLAELNIWQSCMMLSWRGSIESLFTF